LCCAPKQYDSGDLPKSDSAIQAYADYTKYVVDHLRGRVDQFEVWNEWNLNTGSKITPRVWGQAEDYVKLLKVAQTAIKSANSKAVVIGGVVGGTDGKWTEKFIQAGGLSYVDGLSVHPYVFHHAHGHGDSREFIWSDVAKSSVGANGPMPPQGGTPEEAMTWIDELKARIDRETGGKNLPIYISEFGWPSSTNPDGVSEELAAAYLQRFMLMAHARPWIAGTYWYDWIDEGSDSNNDEHRFGLRRQNGDAKPNYKALAAISEILRSGSPAKQSIGKNGDIVISGTLRNNKEFVASWSPTDKAAAPTVVVK
jgi:polysaccharide biosynthesis protein PslG